jgi:hypothetical protein
MAKAVIHRPLTAEARVRARVCSCGFVEDKVALRHVFLKSSSAFPCHYHSTGISYNWGMSNEPVGGRSSETVTPNRHNMNKNGYRLRNHRTEFNESTFIPVALAV